MSPTASRRPDGTPLPPRLRRKHHLAALVFQAARGRRNRHGGLTPCNHAAQRRRAPTLSWLDDEQEGRALARSTTRLPSDHAREQRPPSLERQEAFRDSSTSKKRSFSGLDELVELEELYRIGLLYDDEHERGSGFSLDTIVHDEPLFQIRPAKRGRGRKRNADDDGPQSHAPVLPLELSFSALGADEALAAFLTFPAQHELVPEARDRSPSASASSAERKAASQPVLTTIYELELEPEDELSHRFSYPAKHTAFYWITWFS